MKKNALITLLFVAFNLSFGQNSINMLSLDFLHLGVKQIDVNVKDIDREYSFVTFKRAYINTRLIDANRFKITQKGNVYFLSDDMDRSINNKYSIEVNSRGQILNVATPYYKGNIEKLDEKLLDDSNFIFLVLFVSELNTTVSNQLSYNSFYNFSNESNSGCSFWDTYYSVGVGASTEGANSHLVYVINQSIKNGELKGCTLLNNKPENTTVAFGLVHLATVTWCCK